MSDFSFASVGKILVGAVVLGTIAGVASLVVDGDGRAVLYSTANDVAVATNWKRARAPEPGDEWGGCDDARAAGTAPIYRDEPGYRSDMDGDGDGIACEPIR